MKKHVQESPPALQSNRKCTGFRIPKKKADSWSEEYKVNSPLARLAEPCLKNVTTRKRVWTSSYDTFNSTRNKDSNTHYQSNSSYFKCNSPQKWTEPRLILPNILETDIGRHYIKDAEKSFSNLPGNPILASPQHNLQRSVGGLNNEIKSSSGEETCDVYKEKGHQVGQKGIKQQILPSKACRDVCNTPSSPLKDCNLRSTRRNSNLEQRDISQREDSQIYVMKSSIISSPSKTTRERTYCQKRVELMHDRTRLQTACILQGQDASYDSMMEDLHYSVNAPNTGGMAIVKSNNECTLTGGTSAITSNLGEDILSKISSKNIDMPNLRNLDNNKVHKSVSQTKHSRETPLSFEPIVLSSDEEERQHAESIEAVNVVQKPLTNIDADKGGESPQQSCEEPSKFKPFLISEDEIICSDEAECMILELTFMNVYIGKKKGRSTGLAKFTVDSIDIPLQVALQKCSTISVDTRKLQKYGLWTANTCVRGNGILFLWVFSDYVQNIEKQMGTTVGSTGSKSNEFIFLELKDPPSKKEQDIVSTIMKKASKRGLPGLTDMPWSMAFPLLKALPDAESAFKANCFPDFCKQKLKPSETKTLPASSLESIETPCTYTLLQSQRDGIYSTTLVPKEDYGWTEVRNAESLLKLIVYPPPPTKGGLGVTNEDLDCLEHGEFLNDVIIDFYLNYLLLEMFPKHFAERSHIFSSFFYKCLTRKDNGSNDTSTTASAAQRRHQRVKTWTRHIDIFTKDFIFVPVNENSHWYLAVICFPWMEHAEYKEKTEQGCAPHCFKLSKETTSKSSVIVLNESLAKEEGIISDDFSSDDTNDKSLLSGHSLHPRSCDHKRTHCRKVCRRPCLLIFDSLKTASAQTTVQVLREYLKVEWEVKKKTAREFSRSNMRDLYPKIPKQNNSTDCGLFLLQYVESFVQKPIENFDHPMYLEDWFPLHVIKSKREDIRDLILKLHLQQNRKSGK